MKTDLPPLPRNMAHLPVDDERGFPVPWFVLWHNGKPEFRVVKPGAREMAWSLGLCWVCGKEMPGSGPLTPQTFVIGPMCVVNRTTAEPGCHKDCAIYSALACPFLSKPKMVRRENHLPDETQDADGFMIRRNPGVTCLWTSETACQFDDGNGGWLIKIGEPAEPPLWYAQGRLATADEVNESVLTGLPILQKMAEQDGPEGVAALQDMVEASGCYLRVVT